MTPLEISILEVVQRYLREQGQGARLGPQDNLRTAGMTSMQMVSLVFELERHFAIRIPDSSLSPNAFGTVESIGRTLTPLLSQSDMRTDASDGAVLSSAPPHPTKAAD